MHLYKLRLEITIKPLIKPFGTYMTQLHQAIFKGFAQAVGVENHVHEIGWLNFPKEGIHIKKKKQKIKTSKPTKEQGV